MQKCKEKSFQKCAFVQRNSNDKIDSKKNQKQIELNINKIRTRRHH